MSDGQVPEILKSGKTHRGSVVLRKRTERLIYELIVNGAFVMDTVETSTEQLLATETLRRVKSPEDIIVGGLGLGFTVQELLKDDRVKRIDVVELEPTVLNIMREGLVPETAEVLSDPRVFTHLKNIRHLVPDQPDADVDAILIDVDNGPDFLVYTENAEIYGQPFLEECRRVLRRGGVLAVWSAARSAPLVEYLADIFGACEEVHTVITREGRELDYYLYLSKRSR